MFFNVFLLSHMNQDGRHMQPIKWTSEVLQTYSRPAYIKIELCHDDMMT